VTARVAVIVAGIVLTVALVRQAGRSGPRGRARRLRPGAFLIPPRMRDFVAGRLARADVDVTPEAALRWWALGIGAGAWFAILMAPPLVVPAIAAAIAAGPVVVATRAGHADRRVRAALPGVLEHLVAQVRAGGTIPEALHAIAARPGPLAPDLRRLSARLALGGALEDALLAWSRERPVPAVRSAAGALAMVTTIGGSVATPLEGLAASLRNDDAAAGEARALSAQARVSALVVGLAPLAYLAFSTLTDPASARVLLDTGAGRVCLALGLALEAGAALWMRALVRPS
jgi:tight adherence protein B